MQFSHSLFFWWFLLFLLFDFCYPSHFWLYYSLPRQILLSTLFVFCLGLPDHSTSLICSDLFFNSIIWVRLPHLDSVFCFILHQSRLDLGENCCLRCSSEDLKLNFCWNWWKFWDLNWGWWATLLNKCLLISRFEGDSVACLRFGEVYFYVIDLVFMIDMPF